ncbi:hypothetical protein SE17_09640 [Kouleothrix aurantiaca]|uniref:Uncharacterized protein n=1 Tax=Kouleothrix aurantiaca TaxID=186479 RepID=A0A0P9DJ12_9CHLR|nr:hypothetical protein SE17_09640 [Kouleothrix aurantiaca]
MPKQHRMAAATLMDLYFGCAMLLVPDAPIPHQLLAGAVRALHGRGDTLTVSELEQARDWLLARRQLRAGPGSDRSFVLIDRKTARQAPTSGEFLAAARQALAHSLLHMVAREPASGQIPDRIWPQIDRVLQWSRARSDAATAALCTFSASHALAQRHFARAVDLLRYALAIDPDPADTIGRRAILAEALLRLGMPDEALSVTEQMAEPPATLPATRQWAAHVAAARASAITPLPWSCVPDDLVYLLGGTPAFRDAYERSLRLAGGQIFELSSELAGPPLHGRAACVLPLDPETTLLARQRSAQAQAGGTAGDITTSWRAWLPPPPTPGGFVGLVVDIQEPARGSVECIFRLDDPVSHALLRQIEATGLLGFLVAPPGDPQPFTATRLLQYLMLEVSDMPDALRERLRRPPDRGDSPQAPAVLRGRRGGGDPTPAA